MYECVPYMHTCTHKSAHACLHVMFTSTYIHVCIHAFIISPLSLQLFGRDWGLDPKYIFMRVKYRHKYIHCLCFWQIAKLMVLCMSEKWVTPFHRHWTD